MLSIVAQTKNEISGIKVFWMDSRTQKEREPYENQPWILKQIYIMQTI
jgi:hypothetical protein